jgi:REP element-mobilizing transposase RayT
MYFPSFRNHHTNFSLTAWWVIEYASPMARISRLVVPDYPRHITQRGCAQSPFFGNDSSRGAYLDIMAERFQRFGVRFFLAWCLMTAHTHLVVLPKDQLALARAIGEARRRYTRMKSFAEDVGAYDESAAISRFVRFRLWLSGS